MSSILIALFILLFMVIAIKRLDVAVLILLASLPLYTVRFKILFLPSTLLEAMIGIVFLVWLASHRRQLHSNLRQKISGSGSGQIIRYPFDIELALILSISLVSVAVAGSTLGSLGIWRAYFLEPALLFIVIVNLLLNRYVQASIAEKESLKISNFQFPISKQFLIFNFFNFQTNNKSSLSVQKIIFVFSVSALVVSVIAVYQKITGEFIPNELWRLEATRRVTSVFGYPNAIGLFLGPLILVFVGWIFYEINELVCLFQNSKFKIQNYNSKFKVYKIIYIITVFVLSILSVIYARSEGALIGIAAGLVLFGLLAGKWLRRITIGSVMTLLIIVSMVSPVRQFAIEKITLNDFSGNVRKLQWAETWKMLEDGRIISGAGLDNYQASIKSYHQEGFYYNKDNDPDFRRKIVIFDDKYKSKYRQPLEIYMYPHNILLNFWSEIGLFGMLIFVWIIIKFFIKGLRIMGRDKLQIPNPKSQINSKTQNPKQISAFILKLKNSNLFKNWKLKIKNYNSSVDRYIALGLICAMAQIIIHGLVDVPYFKNDLSIMFWILIAIIGVLDIERQKASNKQ